MPQRAPTSPTLNLQIPSLHDSHLLPTRLYLPPTYTHPTTPPTPWTRKLALVAHPYAPLGGSYDDPVVLRLVALLSGLGWAVATFNFRGRGRTSWTGRAEVRDYVSVCAWALAYVQSLPQPPGVGGAGVREREMELLLAGYSYGSLITSMLPGTERGIVALLDGGEGTVFGGAVEAARASARRWWDSHSSARTSYSGPRGERGEVLRAVGVEGGEEGVVVVEKRWRVTSRYLLVSPPLPPVSSFLMGFGTGAWAEWVKGVVGMGAVDGAEEEEGVGIEEEGVKVLAVYGDGDTFTGARKYRKWKERMGKCGTWTGVEVEGAGHFWHESGAMGELERAVKTWLR